MIENEIILNKISRKPKNLEMLKLGVDGENLQEKIIFKFEDEFVEGQARVEIELQDETKYYVLVNEVNNSYELPIKSVITKKGLNYIQLVITENGENEIPIFKSEKIPILISESINAVGEAPDEYESWVDILEGLVAEVNSLKNDLQQKVESGYFDGKDALINGYNVLNIVAGEHIILEQNENTLTISAEGVAPYPDNHLETKDGDIFMTSDDAYFVVKESE